jgi:hypothetical protein
VAAIRCDALIHKANVVNCGEVEFGEIRKSLRGLAPHPPKLAAQRSWRRPYGRLAMLKEVEPTFSN